MTKDAQEAFERLRAAVEAEMPELVSFGDSMTMRDTGIVEWLRRDGRWRLLDGFDASMPRPERLEIRRQALLSDLFVTGINAVTEEGTLHWLDMVGNRIAPVAFGPPARCSSWRDATKSWPTAERPKNASGASPRRKT